MTAKKLAETIAEEVKIAGYISSAQVKLFIIEYAKQEVKKRDEQWIKALSVWEYRKNKPVLPEPEFE